uniref:Neurexin-4 n=1 Tax=Schistosoma mansoni TaxID=6183 RepID=A0A5K4F366_SCHMA
MNQFRFVNNFIVVLIMLFFYQQRIMADFLFRTPGSYAILPELKPCPSGGLYFSFFTTTSTGLLLYTENNITGQFLALTLLHNSRIKLELELRSPQYRITRAHTTITLDYSEKCRSETHLSEFDSRLSHKSDSIFSSRWNTVEITFESQTNHTIDGVKLKINKYHTHMRIFPPVDFSPSKHILLGHYMFMGQLSDEMRSDATQRALFSAAMQPSFQGIIKDIYVIQCPTLYHSKLQTETNYSRQCIPYEPIILENGALKIHSYSSSLNKLSHFCSSQTNPSNEINGLINDLSYFNLLQKQTSSVRCEKDSSNVLNLNGQNHAAFHFNTVGIDEKIFFEFRTRQENQIMFSFELTSILTQHAKMKADSYLLGYLLNGALVVNLFNHFSAKRSYLNQPGSQKIISCISDYDTCADTQWHQILLTIKKNDIFLVLDSQSPIKLNPLDQDGLITVKIMHLGRSLLNTSKETFTQFIPSAGNLTNFRGCFQSIIYKSGEIFIPLLSTKNTKYVQSQLPVQSNQRTCDYKLLQSKSNIDDSKTNSFVSFIKPGSYLRIKGWKVVLHGEITFILRTTTLNGLIIYSNSINEHELFPRYINEPNLLENIHEVKQTGFDIFALELRLGRLHFLLNTGSGIVQPEFDRKYFESESKGFISDGKEHSIQIVFDEGDLTINVDGENLVTHGTGIKTYKYLNLNEYFYIGGLPESVRQINSFISPEVWSAQLRQDFVGCLGEFIVNKRLWDIDLERRPCWSKPFVEYGCRLSPSIDFCTDKPCRNKGQCISSWNIFECDCSNTNFSGKICTENPIIVSFDGFQWLWIKFSPLPIQSSVEELTLRFRTKYEDGFLLTTRSSILSAPDCLELKIISGYLSLIYNLGAVDNVYHNPVYIADDQWHTVKIYRRQNVLNFSVDNLFQTFDIPKDGRYLSHRHLILGNSEDSLTNQLIDTPTQFRHNIKQINNLNVHVFIGYIMVFLFNGVDFLRTAQNLKHDPSLYIWKDKLDITATQSNYEPNHELPLTFNNKDSTIEIQLEHSTSEFVLGMWIKWKKYGAVLFLQDGFRQNFILESIDGRLQLIHVNNDQTQKYSIGGNQRVVVREWYHIEVIKQELTKLMLIRVNNQSTFVKMNISNYFALKTINIGSLSTRNSNYDTYGNYIHRTTGFQGCVASFSFNYSIDYGQSSLNIKLNNTAPSRYQVNYLYSNDTQKVSLHNIQMGCHFSDTKHLDMNQCSENPCRFNGICMQQWDSVTCDCSLTGFTGKFCDKAGTSVRLSEFPRRYAVFELNSPQNTTLDKLAFGIQITNPGTMSLIHIQGQGQSPDFIQLSVLHNKNQLNLHVRFNMGGGTQTLFQPNVNFNDGHFHIVQFIRKEAKSILLVDFQHEITKPTEDQNNKHFNMLKRIYFGEAPKMKENLSVNNNSKFTSKKGFEGFITGLNLNNINLTDLLYGNMVPGIYLKTRENIEFNPNFKPNMKKLHAHSKRTEPEARSQNEANDMQLTATDYHDGINDYKTQSIVVPKTECLRYDSSYNYKECQPADLDGIIQPLITFSDNPLTMRAADKNELQQGWNADQSNNNNRQSSASDSGFLQGYSKLDQSTVHQDEMEPIITNWLNFSSKISQKHKEITPALDKISYGKNNPTFDNILYKKSKNPFTSFVERNKKFPFNIVLIIAVSVSGICVLIILTCTIYRCMRRDEGTYNVEESTAYTGETVKTTNIVGGREHIISDSSIPLISLQPELIKSITFIKPNYETTDVDDRSLMKLNLDNIINESSLANDKISENNPDVIVIDKTITNVNPITNNDDCNNIQNTYFIADNNNKQVRNTYLKVEKRKSTIDPKEWYV